MKTKSFKEKNMYYHICIEEKSQDGNEIEKSHYYYEFDITDENTVLTKFAIPFLKNIPFYFDGKIIQTSSNKQMYVSETANFAQEVVDEYFKDNIQSGTMIPPGFSKRERHVFASKYDITKIIMNKAQESLREFSANVKNDICNENETSQIFISHSSKDREFILHFSKFLKDIGIKSIFCSSIDGQGIKNGERLEEEIRKNILKSKLLFYIFDNEFFKSVPCVEELGAGWILRDKGNPSPKKTFFLKFDDISFKDFPGLITSDFKCTELNEKSLLSLIDDISDAFEIQNKKATENSNVVETFLSGIRGVLIDKKEKEAEHDDSDMLSDAQKNHYYKTFKQLSNAEKNILSQLFFNTNISNYFNPSMKEINLLLKKKLIKSIQSDSPLLGKAFCYSIVASFLLYITINEEIYKEISDLQPLYPK